MRITTQIRHEYRWNRTGVWNVYMNGYPVGVPSGGREGHVALAGPVSVGARVPPSFFVQPSVTRRDRSP